VSKGCNPCFKWDARETGRVDDAQTTRARFEG